MKESKGFIPKIQIPVSGANDKVLYVLCNGIWEKDGSIDEKNLMEFIGSLYSFAEMKKCKKVIFSFLITDDLTSEQEVLINNWEKCLTTYGLLNNKIFSNTSKPNQISIKMGKQFCKDKRCWKSFDPKNVDIQDVELIEKCVKNELESIEGLSSIIGIEIDDEKFIGSINELKNISDYTSIKAERVVSFDNTVVECDRDVFWRQIPDFEGRRKKQLLWGIKEAIQEECQRLDNGIHVER